MDFRIIIVSIIIMILIGVLSKKIGLLKEEDVETLNNAEMAADGGLFGLCGSGAGCDFQPRDLVWGDL